MTSFLEIAFQPYERIGKAGARMVCCAALALLLAGCGGDTGESARTQEPAPQTQSVSAVPIMADVLPAPSLPVEQNADADTLVRSQRPQGDTVSVRLPSHDNPVELVLKDGLAFLGDQVKGYVDGGHVIGTDQRVIAHLDGSPLSAHESEERVRPQGSGIIRNPEQKWPGGVIPYEFDGSATPAARNAFLVAKADFDAKTAVRFVPRNGQANYIRIVTKDGCYSYVGRTFLSGQPQGQELSLGSGCGVNPARHEMGHALGLAHEQVRQDRDQWVVVNSTSSQDQIDRGSAGVPIGAYDFESMMHYNNARLGNGRWVYEPKTGFPPELIGNRRYNTFTLGDLAAIEALYGPPPGRNNPPGGQGVALIKGNWISMQVVTPSFTGRYLRHAGSDAFTEVIGGNSAQTLKQDASWRIVAALDGTPCYSFESRNYPGHFLRHTGYRLRKDPMTNDDIFRKDATFCAQTGLAGAGGISFVSRNYPNHYIRHRNAEVWLDRVENSQMFWLDASWNLMSAWAP
jgi:Alpha-L-arabinofuranosidase B (ABFB) domain/Astacin (Peptidase family M12A)